MKKNVRNALAISGLAIAIGTSGFTLDASANTGSRGQWQGSHQERILRPRKFETGTSGRRIVVGTVSAVSDNSVTITSGLKTFTVNTSGDTRLLNQSWKTINFSNIAVGNKIRVFGTIADLTVTAQTVRDISLQ